MAPKMSRLLAESCQDEISALIEALAVSVVQHRARCAFVALSESTDRLDETPADLSEQGGEVVQEVLELLRIREAEKAALAANPGQASQDPAERRWQLRIDVRAPVQVRWPGQDTPTRAVLENISWGGVAFHVGEVHSEIGDTIDVLLPSPRGGAISIKARVLRTWDLEGEDGKGAAARFTSVSTSDEAELENILTLLAQSGDEDGQRRHARLVQRLDIQFDEQHELQATMDDISAGGMGIIVPDPLQIGQSIQAVVSSLDGKHSLKLRARVVRQEPVPMPPGRMPLYDIGLKFEHPTEQLAQQTEEFVNRMASMRRSLS